LEPMEDLVLFQILEEADHDSCSGTTLERRSGECDRWESQLGVGMAVGGWRSAGKD